MIMEMYFLAFLIVAWILSIFGFDTLFVTGVRELFGKEISVGSYYLIFLLLGLFFDFVKFFKK